MPHENSVMHDLLKRIPWDRFDALVEKHEADRTFHKHFGEGPGERHGAEARTAIGAVLDFLHDGTDIQAGARTEMTDAFLGYSAWCKAQSLRPMGVDEFVDAMDKCCKQFGIRTAVESDAHYLLDVQLLPATAAQKKEEGTS